MKTDSKSALLFRDTMNSTWYGNCSASDCKALQVVVHTPQYITGARFLAIQDLYTRWYQRKVLKMAKES
jgi:hypothetical protein